ncbi:MAG: glycosyltransferase family 2 protein [Selenomonadaceae bacterium]|nr:glycosyltransferase family 2 protein [Selenomonadaceae bacterium]
MSDLFSIVIPVYNSRQYMESTIDDVINQSYTNIEVILIDDGSTDGSSEICDQYAATDIRFKVVHNQNAGPSNAKNCGIKLATGKYITFVDADDSIEPDYIASMAVAFTDNVNLVITDFDNWNFDGDGKVSRHNDYLNVSKLSGKDVIKDYCLLNSRVFANCCKAFRLDIIKRHKVTFPEDCIMAEDQIFNDQYYQVMGGEYRYIPKCLYHYMHRNPSSLSSSPSIKAFNSDAKCLKLKREFFTKVNMIGGDEFLSKYAIGLIRKYYFTVPSHEFAKFGEGLGETTPGVNWGNKLTLWALKQGITFPILVKKYLKLLAKSVVVH